MRAKGSKLTAKTVAVSIILGAMLMIAARSDAHEVPNDVVVQMYLKPEPRQVVILMSVPLEAMRDVTVPLRGPGYIRIDEADESLRDAVEIWLTNFIKVYADDSLLGTWSIDAVRVSLPSDLSFASYTTAYRHTNGTPLPVTTDLYRDQALLDVMVTYPLASAATDFAINPDLGRLGLRTTTVLHFMPEEGVQRMFRLVGSPGLVPLDPRWYQAFGRFVQSGIGHILDGTDHLLFVLCLIIPFRRLRPLVAVVTSFTVAHSITLIASAYSLLPNALWFPPLIETLIAASIVYMALENIVGSRWERRWMIAFGFGLVHGFGFSFALSESLQFAGSHLLTSLLAFNLGVEIGQLMIIVIAVPILNLLFRTVVSERMGTIVLSALLAHSGWHWMSERAAALSEYQWSWPAMNAAFLASILRWLMLLLIIGVAVWLLYKVYRRFVMSTT
ncbi:MAG: HupE/UreJ family protein [Gammaproteobacteria bacterium]|nr:HupE/UreJ family protein [Gammaproteobacteria bacterium]